ncbi:MAG: hypothetical protein OXC37_03810, partial [Bdellovibrionaceae bacterium]|nr:hypothetical protein [Pseudobdellovibrionaceae bacterium]
KRLINLKQQVISGYWKYNYSVSSEVSLNTVSADYKKYSKQPLAIKSKYLNKYPLTNKLNQGFNLHIFFNLQPVINCFSESDNFTQTCKIRYNLDEYSSDEEILSLNEDKYFFSEEGLQADMTCLDIADCSCSQPYFVFEKDLFGEVGFIEVKCSMSKGQSGFIQVGLKTKSPYIYFLNKDLDEKSIVFRKNTSIERLKVELK